MAIFKLHKGLDIRLNGVAATKKGKIQGGDTYGLVPDDFGGIMPKVVVREGDTVKAGDFLFVDKRFPEVGFASPVSGVVTSVLRGDRRKLLCVKVKADSKQVYKEFGVKNVSKMTAHDVRSLLMDAGLFGYIKQLPYAVSAEPASTPKAIFVSAFRDMPLSADFDYELEGNEDDFQTGLTALSRMAKTYLGVSPRSAARLTEMKDVEVNVFDGPCPSANVGVQVNHISPVNKGEVVWTVDPTAVIFFGRLINTGKVDLRKTVALAGSEVNDPCYYDVLVGQPLSGILAEQIDGNANNRIINGNPLTGRLSNMDDFVGPHTSEVCVIPEGNDRDELLGWIMPRLSEFSVNRSYFTWMQGKRGYTLDARVKGGERHMIMSGEYDKVLPMDIYGEYLIKALIAGDIDKMEQLGIYEVAPEDFAVAEFVDSSKVELQRIVREGLDMLRKENE